MRVRKAKKSPSMVKRAREVLKEEFERNPDNPSKHMVRKLGLELLHNTPGVRRTVKRYPADSKLRKIRRVVTKTATVKDGERWATIKLDKISTHQRRPWVPRQLGRLAFKDKSPSKPIEVLSLATEKLKHRVEVSEPSALPVAAEVTALLLAISATGDKDDKQ